MTDTSVSRQYGMAIDVLDKLGIIQPSTQQIAQIEAILFTTSIKTNIYFDPQLSKREITCVNQR